MIHLMAEHGLWKLVDSDRVNEFRADVGLPPLHPIPERGPDLPADKRQGIEENECWWKEWLASKGWSSWPQSSDPAEPDLTQAETDMNTLDNSRAILLEELRNLETELHKDETRRNRKRMEMLLHPDFVEFGRSGTRYTRSDILGEFGPESVLPVVHSRQFDLVVLAEGVALVTYLSAHVDAVGNLYRHTLRSSIWVCSDVGWQMRFHQGTPTTAAIIDQP
jgi:hypothetical protein